MAAQQPGAPPAHAPVSGAASVRRRSWLTSPECATSTSVAASSAKRRVKCGPASMSSWRSSPASRSRGARPLRSRCPRRPRERSRRGGVPDKWSGWPTTPGVRCPRSGPFPESMRRGGASAAECPVERLPGTATAVRGPPSGILLALAPTSVLVAVVHGVHPVHPQRMLAPRPLGVDGAGAQPAAGLGVAERLPDMAGDHDDHGEREPVVDEGGAGAPDQGHEGPPARVRPRACGRVDHISRPVPSITRTAPAIQAA